MEANTYNKYRIKISDSKFECIETNGERGKGFLYPDVSDKLPKYGFSATGKHGYHGYKWKDQDTVEILIWSFPDSIQEHLEAIEAELYITS
jgi:hypothetical protein